MTYKKTNNKLEKKYNFTLWITQIVDKLPKIQHTFVMKKNTFDKKLTFELTNNSTITQTTLTAKIQ